MPAGLVCAACNRYFSKLESALGRDLSILHELWAIGIPPRGRTTRTDDSLPLEMQARREIRGDQPAPKYIFGPMWSPYGNAHREERLHSMHALRPDEDGDPTSRDSQPFSRALHKVAINCAVACHGVEAAAVRDVTVFARRAPDSKSNRRLIWFKWPSDRVPRLGSRLVRRGDEMFVFVIVWREVFAVSLSKPPTIESLRVVSNEAAPTDEWDEHDTRYESVVAERFGISAYRNAAPRIGRKALR